MKKIIGSLLILGFIAVVSLHAQDVPQTGTFWLQSYSYNGNLGAPYPFDPYFGSEPMVQLTNGSWLIEDTLADRQAMESMNSMRGSTTMSTSSYGMTSMDGPEPLGGGTNGAEPNFPARPDYGTNLWIRMDGVSAGIVNGIVSNSVADILYEIQSAPDLLGDWTSEGFLYGSELTNWTALSLNMNGDTNQTRFFRIRSWEDSTGTGIPDWWWLQYFGQTTNVDAYAYAAGDGWNNLYKFQNGMIPTNFYTPPAPQDFNIIDYNTVSNWATLSWTPSPGPVTGYTLQIYPSGSVNLSSDQTTYVDYSSSISGYYRLQVNYAGGSSSWSGWASVSDFLNPPSPSTTSTKTLNATIAAGPLGTAYLAVGGLPQDTAAIRLSEIDGYLEVTGGGNPLVTNFDIPINNFSNGIYALPNAPVSSSIYRLEYGYYWTAQAVDSNGIPSQSAYLRQDYAVPTGFTNSWLVPPFYDGRRQLKDNLVFQLRAATLDSLFQYTDFYTDQWGSEYYSVNFPTTYVYAGYWDFQRIDYWDGTYNFQTTLDVFRPFKDNYVFRNFVFNTADLDSSGHIATGAGGTFDSWPYTLTLQEPYEYQFIAPATNNVSISSLLTSDQTGWLSTYPVDSGSWDLGEIGITNYYDDQWNEYDTMFNNVSNYWGLTFLSAKIAWDNTGSGNTTLSAGNSIENTDGYFYPEAAQPQFQTVGYYFYANSPNYFYLSPTDQFPGIDTDLSTYTNFPLITSVGSSAFRIIGFAKLAVTNAYPGVYGYLGQYFDTACQIDNSGSVTTNQAGILSSYGEFFATEPGQVAVTTMPDVDTGEQGTNIVNVIALDVDANHDGTMDFSYFGPDQTSGLRPFRFWVNDDADSGDYGGNGIPGQPLHTADGNNYSEIDYNSDPLYRIHGTRDLVDFFPVYINIGSMFQSNAVSAGISFTDTNWQFVLSQGDGVLRFAYTDLSPTNYMNFLRDTNEARELGGYPGETGNYAGAQLTTISNIDYGGAPLSAAFIANIVTNNGGIILVEAAAPTTQPLVLSIYHGTNLIGQANLNLSISGVEQMFRSKTLLLHSDPRAVADRLTDADVPNEPDTIDKNFIFLHGYNVNPQQARGWDADIFKRLYWSGSHAKFYGVTWEAADSQIAGQVTINLQTNIVNAFNTAPLFNDFLNSLTGTNVVAAHSLGNMLALSTLNDYTNQTINTYFMIDAAVAIEAIDPSAPQNPDMYPSAWTSYESNLWASEWHNLWPANDARSTLTWSGRLANLQNASVYNFYSSGEEVLRDYPVDPPDYLTGIAAGQLVSLMEGETGEYTWAWQEKLKGLMPANFLLSSDHGGWQFNEAYETNIIIDGSPYWEPMSPSAAAELTTQQLQTNAFFNFGSQSLFPFNDDLALESSSGSSYAQANRNRILSDAIPCLTLPLGANADTNLDIEFGETRNFDEQANYENGWPPSRGAGQYPVGTTFGEWHHSDVRAVAYTFTYKLFNQMVNLGNLK